MTEKPGTQNKAGHLSIHCGVAATATKKKNSDAPCRVKLGLATTIIMVALLSCAPPEGRAAYSGMTEATGHIIVGAAASCLASAEDLVIPSPAKMPNSYAATKLTYNCPGANQVYMGLLVDDGTVQRTATSAATSGRIATLSSIQTDQDSTTNLSFGGTDYNVSTMDHNLGMPANVKTVLRIYGESGTQYINATFICSASPCALRTGAWPYTIRIYGYWL